MPGGFRGATHVWCAKDLEPTDQLMHGSSGADERAKACGIGIMAAAKARVGLAASEARRLALGERDTASLNSMLQAGFSQGRVAPVAAGDMRARMQDIISRCWDGNAAERPTAGELVHMFIAATGAVERMEGACKRGVVAIPAAKAAGDAPEGGGGGCCVVS